MKAKCFSKPGSPNPANPAAAKNRRPLFLSAAPMLLAMLLIWGLGGHKVKMTRAKGVSSGQGVVYFGPDRNYNTKLELKVSSLAEPGSLKPAEADYVVWIQPPGHPAQNMGVLHIGTDQKGQFQAVTPYRFFAVFVTAEKSPHVRKPVGKKVLYAKVIRR